MCAKSAVGFLFHDASCENIAINQRHQWVVREHLLQIVFVAGVPPIGKAVEARDHWPQHFCEWKDIECRVYLIYRQPLVLVCPRCHPIGGSDLLEGCRSAVMTVPEEDYTEIAEDQPPFRRNEYILSLDVTVNHIVLVERRHSA